MNKGTLNQLFQSPKTYRIQKLVTLVTASCVFLALVSIDASASTAARGDAVGTAVLEYYPAPPAAATTAQPVGNVRELQSLTASSHAAVASTKTTSSKKTATTTKVDRSNGTFGKHRNKTKVTTTFSTPTTSKSPTAPTTSTTQRPAPPVTTTSSSGTSTNAPAQTTTTTGKPAPTTTTTGKPAPTTTTTAKPAPTTTTTAPPTTTTTTGSSPNTAYPIGTLDSSDQTGYSPPGAGALAGYSQSYVTTFTGTSMPANWFLYRGQPGGDPGTDFDPAHVTVSGGLLRINTYEDPNYANAWVTGGTSYSGTPGQTYGAYFVRSRITGPGDDNDELLWPDGSEWPPEVDFNETYTTSTGTNSTVHFNAANDQDMRAVTIDMTQWHTWGVIWTPTSIVYTVDGNVWGSVTKTAEIPTVPMHLSIQSQTFCSAGWACPTANNSLLVDWVAIYKPN